MMKNKNNLYMLVGAVFLIWGIVGYKIFIYLNTNSNAPASHAEPAPLILESRPVVEADVLLLNYPDPFLKNVKKESPKRALQQRETTTAKNTSGTNLVNNREEINWSVLKYSGMIKNNSSTEKVALMQFDAKNYMVREGDTVGDFLIISIFEDSIYVKHDKVFQFLKR